MRFAAAMFFIAACGGPSGATVVEVPPQELPAPEQQATATVTVSMPMQQAIAGARAMNAGEEWVGRYRCAQGETELVLHIDSVQSEQVSAVFEFLHGPSGAAGSYRMSGRLDARGALTLFPGDWINQMPNYVTVGMHGMVRGNGYSGRMDNPSCGGFHVTRR